jgi:UDP-N-acetylglucosamine 1-carboxyvinyltransferase
MQPTKTAATAKFVSSANLGIRERFVVEGLAGRKTLKGKIEVFGAKNAALKGGAASILFSDTVVLKSVPFIEDVERIHEVLRGSGAAVLREGHTIAISQPTNWRSELEGSIASRIRASIVLTGPMLARTGEVTFPFPGGCVLGERSIDFFLDGFKAMGATVEERTDEFTVKASQQNGKASLHGANIFFPFVSVTATETLMMAATLAEGVTVLQNAAVEPEVPALAEFLNSCGASISGAGTSTITINGTSGKLLEAQGKAWTMPPDRIETGSFALLAALSGEDVTITNCDPNHVDALLVLLKRAGVQVETGEAYIRIQNSSSDKPLKMVSVRTHEYPGFPTDLQAPIAVFMTQLSGEGTILETIFDGRFRYAEEIAKMGADITVMNPHRILVRGPRALTSRNLESPDIRAGLAYLLAAIVASGTSIVDNAYVIDRGYERLEERLKGIGLSIRREVAR